MVIANFDARLANMAIGTMQVAGVGHLSGLDELLVFLGGTHLDKQECRGLECSGNRRDKVETRWK